MVQNHQTTNPGLTTSYEVNYKPVSLVILRLWVTSSIRTASFSLKGGHSDLSIRPHFLNGIDAIFDSRKDPLRGIPSPPRRPSGIVVSPAMSCPVLTFQTIFWNQPEPLSIIQLSIDSFVCPIICNPFGCWAFSKTRDQNRPCAQTGRMKCATDFISFETNSTSSGTNSTYFEITCKPIGTIAQWLILLVIIRFLYN